MSDCASGAGAPACQGPQHSGYRRVEPQGHGSRAGFMEAPFSRIVGKAILASTGLRTTASVHARILMSMSNVGATREVRTAVRLQRWLARLASGPSGCMNYATGADA